MIAATGKLGVAAAAAISEAVVNLGSSIFLASRYGAIGVAVGTFLGSIVSVTLHFAITMRFTRQTLAISRLRLFLTGFLRPAAIVVPSMVLLPLWSFPAHPVLGPRLSVAWSLSTLSLAWLCGLTRKERSDLIRRLRGRPMLPFGSQRTIERVL